MDENGYVTDLIEETKPEPIYPTEPEIKTSETVTLESTSEIIKIQEDMKQDADESISDCNGKTPALPDGKNLSGKANKYKKK
jgi:hypothetical protein